MKLTLDYLRTRVAGYREQATITQDTSESYADLHYVEDPEQKRLALGVAAIKAYEAEVATRVADFYEQLVSGKRSVEISSNGVKLPAIQPRTRSAWYNPEVTK